MRPHRTLLAALAAVVVLLVAGRARATQYVIDEFSAPSSPAPWAFSNGPEFPGATGSLTSGPGISGNGAALSYDFTGGGQYVSMSLTLPKPLTITVLSYAATAAGVHTVLRVVDTSNQVLQYEVNRPLEAGGPSAWYTQVVDLTTPTSWYGGADDGALHQPITAVSLLAGNPLQPGLVGTAGFDSVVAWDTLPPTLDPDASPLAAPAGAGTLASGLGVNIHFTSDDKALDVIADAGMTRVRMDLGWAGVETQMGKYDFSAFDALVSSLATRGLRLHLILDYFNPLYPNAAEAGYDPTTVDAFAAVSKAVAAHFAGKGVTYEIWNEENGGFWVPSANAPQYAELCSASIAAIHQGDPSALVTTGGLAGFDDVFLEAMLDAGGGVGANAVGVHPYRQGGGESASDDLAFMRAIVASSYATPPPVWDTEWGYSSQWYGGDAGGQTMAAWMLQAQRVSRELLSAWALGFPLEIYYDIRDDGTDPTYDEDNFGLIQNDYAAKPALSAVRTLTKAADGRTLTGFLPVGFTSLHAMLMVGATDRVVALWNDAPGSVRSVAVPANGTAVDMLGSPVPLATEGGATSVTVSEIAGPLFLTFPNPPASHDAGVDGGASPPIADGGVLPVADSGEGAPDATIDGSGKSGSTGSGGGCGCVVGSRGASSTSLGAAFALCVVWIARSRRRRGASPSR